MRRKLSWHFYAVCLVIAVAASAIAFYANRKLEFSYERADIEAMRGAEATAMLKWKNKLPEEPIEYWYDVRTFSLIPVSDSKPKAFGVGTPKEGGASKQYEADYDYDGREDYRNKVIHVVVSESGGELTVQVDWVNAV